MQSIKRSDCLLSETVELLSDLLIALASRVECIHSLRSELLQLSSELLILLLEIWNDLYEFCLHVAVFVQDSRLRCS